MSRRSRWLRWTATFLGFPLGGLLAVTIVGASDTLLTGALGGALVGLVLGGAQWLALRSSDVPVTWWPTTVVALAVGNAAGVLLTDGATTASGLALRGAVAGATLGLAQGLVVGATTGRALAWSAVTSGAWTVGWLVTSQVIVDAERGFAVFGSSGAILATVLTGLALDLVVRAQGTTRLPAADLAVAATR